MIQFKLVKQKARPRQAVINYAGKYGVTKVESRYDGILFSLVDKSYRPHVNPNQHAVVDTFEDPVLPVFAALFSDYFKS